MTGECATWVFQAGCFTGELATGSLPEWITAIVTVFALLAAVYAGIAASSAAKSARGQATAAAEALRHSREQAQAAVDSVKHSEDAARSSRDQAVAAQEAFEADAKVREEAQARLVYSTVSTGRWIEKGEPAASGDTTVIYDIGYLSNPTTDATGKRVQETRELGLQLIVTVHNNSSEILGGFTVAATHAHNGETSPQGNWVDAVAPNGREVRTIVIPMPGVDMKKVTPDDAAVGWVVSMQYRDSSGVWWSRAGSDPIVKIDLPTDDLL